MLSLSFTQNGVQEDCEFTPHNKPDSDPSNKVSSSTPKTRFKFLLNNPLTNFESRQTAMIMIQQQQHKQHARGRTNSKLKVAKEPFSILFKLSALRVGARVVEGIEVGTKNGEADGVGEGR